MSQTVKNKINNIIKKYYADYSIHFDKNDPCQKFPIEIYATFGLHPSYTPSFLETHNENLYNESYDVIVPIVGQIYICIVCEETDSEYNCRIGHRIREGKCLGQLMKCPPVIIYQKVIRKKK